MISALLLLGVAVLVALNGFFVAAEFALVRVKRSKIEALREDGARSASLSLRQIDEINEYLSACQLGITMASIGIGFLGEPAVARLIEPLIEGAVGHAVALAISIFIAVLITTAAHITVGEQVPKIYAITHAEGTALRVARPLQWFSTGFKPLIDVLNRASNGMLRLLGVNPTAEFDEASSSEDLKMIIAQSLQGGELEENEAEMLSGVFHLHEQRAGQVMTPIPAVVTVDVSDDVGTALQRCVDSGHTRLVAIEDGDDNRVRGVVHNNSLARVLMADGRGASIEPLIKDAFIVPETRPLDDLLEDLQRQRVTLAVVADEYGRTVGIVSVEDIIEEIVGEIADETDPAGGAVRRLPNGDWYVRGHVPIADLEDHGIRIPVESEAYNSVGGFIFDDLGRLPKRGDMARSNGYSLRVESVRENRVQAVRIRDHEPGSRDNGDTRESVRDGG